MELGTVLSAAQTLNLALHSKELNEVVSTFGYKSQLEDLKYTVNTINMVLRDAETKQELSHVAQIMIEKLKDAVFETDDLFDEFVTLVVEQKQLPKADTSFSRKVRSFFSRSGNPLSLAYRMSREIKAVRRKLDAIAYDSQLIFRIATEPTRMKSCSYVSEVDIIGREVDLEKIVDTLLASNNNDQSDVSVLSIVGVGGLGKTALAQLLFNDPRVTRAFQLKMWTCLSDPDDNKLDLKSILGDVLGPNLEVSTLETMLRQLQARLAGKNYLLILDDVWIEDRAQWLQLVQCFTGTIRGSWIVVTTRSKTTATITGGLMYELSGLSVENSWHLFERLAFTLDPSSPCPPSELVEIGKEIVQGCRGVPLAIRVVGPLLYGQDKNKWLSFKKFGLANIESDDGIMPALKLSFHNLEPQLKNCFRYCALFPKDYVIDKDLLISLWMAQGYIVPLDEGQSIDEAGEEYFSILSNRGFFQDIKFDIFGEIESCKIHDLMHDVAQNVSGKEMCALDLNEGNNVDKNVRHLSILGMSDYEEFLSLGNSHIRSLLFFHCKVYFQTVVETVGKFRCLRVLDLSDKNIEHLPRSIGELFHLRYIDLSGNDQLEKLPRSITKLSNLQTLILYNCVRLKELPEDLRRLVNLRMLDIRECDELTSMPRGMGRLTCLSKLKGGYLVGREDRCTNGMQWFDLLNELKTLINLRGKLQIVMWWPKNAKNDVKEDMTRGLYLKGLKHLNQIELDFVVENDSDEEEDSNEEDSGKMNEDEEGIRMRVMEDLQPHSHLKSLNVSGYHGMKMPGWISSTPHLVTLLLYNCSKLNSLPCLGNLCHLKSLCLERLSKLEYIEEDSRMLADTGTSAQKASFFPALEQLRLYDLPKFKGWRRGVGMEESSNISSSHKQCLSQLQQLAIYRCPNFSCILICPMLETLKLQEFNERLRVYCSETDEISSEAAVIENTEKLDTSIAVPMLRNVIVSNGAWLNSMPVKFFHSLQTLGIYKDGEMVELPNCMQYMSALQALRIWDCENLQAMPIWMPRLTSLAQLEIRNCSE